MENCSENILKRICCTCLSKNRNQFQLCRVNDGVNILYLLLSSDSEAFKEGFFKDTATLFICWECKAIMRKICDFRQKACIAQKHLTAIADGRVDWKLDSNSISYLSTHHITTYETVISEATVPHNNDNFIDCGPAEIKTEVDLDDVMLAELQDYSAVGKTEDNVDTHLDAVDTDFKACHVENKEEFTRTATKGPNVGNVEHNCVTSFDEKYFTTMQMSEEEMLNYEMMRSKEDIVNDVMKCEPCGELFLSRHCSEEHYEKFHKEKLNHTKCDLCNIYSPDESIVEHRASHYQRHSCKLCDYVCNSQLDIVRHLKDVHSVKCHPLPLNNIKRLSRKTKDPDSSPRRTKSLLDKSSPYGFKCPHCDKYFEKKNSRYKHIRRYHAEGFACTVCGKRYPFKDNLVRHERLHQGPMAREECPDCHKMVRVDLMKVHARIHSKRETHACVECDKKFVSRASYESHLKYSQAHTALDVLKYKCSVCDKGYRSKGELRDHINYQHLGKTRHKCPICAKALATRRCITRHVRRAHHDIKENRRDKICQQCGKAFRDKKGLREHEFIHTGERPLSCEICGCTFRQSAALYTHRRRVHNVRPDKKNVLLLED